MRVLDITEPLALAVVGAIRAGDVAALRRLLAEHPWLATARIRGTRECSTDANLRTLLHVLTDWPGDVPHARPIVDALVAAGADVDARFVGPHAETPLHWAASGDHLEALEALLDAGADIEAPGAVIAGGTALADATAFGQWRAARRLLERGARVRFWEAAAMGLVDRLEQFLGSAEPPSPDEITRAFWGACHGGQRAAAELLLERGADRDWVGWDGKTPLDAAERSGAAEVVEWLRGCGAKSAVETAG